LKKLQWMELGAMPEEDKIYCAVGLMSGTSMDGVDAAIIYTDGETVERNGPSLTVPYSEDIRARIKEAINIASSISAPTSENEFINQVERDLTDIHHQAVEELRAMMGGELDMIDVIGFHGQTIAHRPEKNWTWQIGNGGRLTGKTGITVVNNMRANDMKYGGEGAPLLPLYHAALLKEKRKHDCIGIVNIGGVA